MSEPAPSVLRAQQIEKSFASGSGTIEVLHGVDFVVHAGESVSIRGESGSGKTTLLNLLAGLERPERGRLEWLGEVVSEWSLDRLAARRTRLIGMVFQAYYLVPEMNALDNVLLASRIAGRIGPAERARAAALLDSVGLAPRATQMPGRLSGGERQRVAIARALVNHPRVILADEPTGNLDERTGNAVMDVLLDLCAREGTALVLVTHNKEHARRTSRQLMLHFGRLEDAGVAA